MRNNTRAFEHSVASSQRINEEKYWAAKLSGQWQRTCFPPSHENKDSRPVSMETMKFQLTGQLFAAVMKLRNNSDPRLFMIMVAGVTALLEKYTCSKDIIIGAPVLAQKIEAEFINTALALRNQIESHMTVKDLLLQVRQTVMEATQHQNYPIERLPGLLGLAASTGSDFPLFDTVVLIENIHDKSFIEDIKVNIIFSFLRKETSIEGTVEYNSLRYDSSTIAGIISHLRHWLQVAAANVNLEIPGIDILGEEEKHQLLYDFNDTRKNYSQDKLLHQLFQEQVEKNPDALVLVSTDEQLTYRELNKRSHQLARQLHTRGINPDTLIGIVSYPGMGMIIGILGILKAGSAYLPLDPTYPKERIQYMLADSNARVIVTTRSLKEEMKLMNGGGIDIFLEDIRVSPLTPGAKKPPAACSLQSAASLAYIIYTSGTTGVPKGVAVEHHSAINTLQCRKINYNLDTKCVSLQLFSYAFDGFVTSFFTPIISGAKVVLLSYEILRDIAGIKTAILKNQITHFISVPSLFRSLQESLAEGELPSLKVVTLAGEQLPPSTVELARQNMQDLEIAHEYGVTEAAIMSTLYRHQEQDQRIKIGVPIWNTWIYILSENFQLQPIGAPGHLCIAGPGVARGYLNKPELTAEKFCLRRPGGSFCKNHPLNPHKNFLLKRTVKDSMQLCNQATMQFPPPHPIPPFSHSPIYLTGDQARWLTDGNIEFLGRIDHQLKLRGFRIEPGEIENHLLAHEKINKALVTLIVSPGRSGNPIDDNTPAAQSLCAYIVAKREFTGTALREFLLTSLPDYMIPTYFIKLEKMPLTPNGKIDRKALPLPELEGKEEFTAPRDETEQTLAEIWSEVLAIDRDMISIDFNFFEQGGYSIKATRLLTKIHKTFSVKLPLVAVFRTPTIRGLAETIKETIADRYIPLEPAEKKDFYVASSAQKRLFILQNLDLKGISYNAPIMVEMERDLDRVKLEEILKQIIHRHEILRNSFHMLEELLVQRVHREVKFKIEYYDITAVEAGSSGEKSRQLEKAIQDFIKPFDLLQPPLMRVGLIKRSETLHLLMVDMHHIISDGASLALMVKEFTLLYNGEPLPRMNIQYKDYTEWQHQDKQRIQIKRQEVFWKNEFAGGIPVLNLPADYARPPDQSFEGTVEGFGIGPEHTAGIKRLITRENATFFVVMLAIYNVFLSKISSQEDIVVGTGLEGRRHEDLQQIIGMFVNTLPLRNVPSGKKRFTTFLNEVREKTLTAFESQEYQFEELVETLVVKRDKSRNPLFDVMFQVGNLESLGTSRLEIPGLKIKSFGYKRKISKFDLTLTAVESGDHLYCSFEYCTKLFKPGTIARFIEYFKEILITAAAQPGQKISKIRAIPAQSKKETLHRLSQELEAEIERIKKSGKRQILQNRLKETPGKFKDKIALEYGASVLTYGELHQRAGNIASRLIEKGIKKGTFIGVLTENRRDLVLAMLGILEAGSVFVPLDATHPRGRLELMINSIHLEFVFTNKTNIITFADSASFKRQETELLRLDDWLTNPGNGVTTHLPPLPPIEYQPDDQVYIYFTSGSTGIPRALLGKNTSLVHFIDWEIDTFEIDESFRFSQLSAPGFDAFLRDTLVPLCGGGTLCIPGSKEIILAAEPFQEWLECSRVHLISCVPSLFRVLTGSHLSRERFPELKVILFSGERITASELAGWFDIFDQRIRLVNLWGTSETTLAKTAHFICKNDLQRERIPVGKPIRGAGVLVLDEQGELCESLVSGELFIRTPFRSFGYYNDPQFNSERFIQNSFSDNDNDLIHKTGDIGRIMLDGTIDLLGRNDRQIKIHGIRVELEEIESLLNKHPRVKEAVAIQKQLSPGNELLCTYVTEIKKHQTGEGSSIDTLWDYLAGKLPGYMVPAKIIPLKEIPRTPNGKVDYQRLPDPMAEESTDVILPRSVIERKLHKIWVAILQLESIGVNQNFFELGGNSLKLMTLISRIHKEFEVRIPLADIFNNPTIEKQARFIQTSGIEKHIAVEPVEKKEYYKLSSAQKRLFFIWQMDVDGISYNIPQGEWLGGTVDKERLETVFQQMFRRHESFRTSFHQVGGEPVQRIHDEVEFSLEYCCVRGNEDVGETREKEVKEIVKNFVRPFDLSRVPLARTQLLKIEGRGYWLLVDIHHIVSDWISSNLLIKEFIDLYTNVNVRLPRLPLQYKDYAQWQNSPGGRDVMKMQEKYWLKEFEGDLPVLNLPFDYETTGEGPSKSDHVAFAVGKEMLEKLRAIEKSRGITMFMIVLTLGNIIFHKLSGQEDIIIGAAAAGRTQPGLENISGMFVNTLAFRNYPKNNMTFGKLLKKVSERAFESLANQDYPFDQLVNRVVKTREIGRNPLFNVLIDFFPNRENDSDVDLEAINSKKDWLSMESKVNLVLVVIERKKSMTCIFSYSRNHFKRDTVKRFSRYFNEILSAVVKNEDILLGDISIFSTLGVAKPLIVKEEDTGFGF